LGKIKKFSFPVLIFGLCFVLGPSSRSGSASQQAAQPQKPLQHEVAVTLKLIQVYVTDKHGQPVTDLTKEDFELTDNGQAKKITDFERHSLVLPAAPQTAQTAVVPTALPMINRKFFLFFDFAFNNMSGIAESKKAALNFIDAQIRLGDEVGVISYTANKGLTLHEYLTTDLKKIRQVVEGMSLNKFLGRAADIEDKWWEFKPEVGVSNQFRSGQYDQREEKFVLSKEKEAKEMIYKAQVGDYFADLAELAKSLRYIPGLKNIIFFSSGVANYLLYGSLKYSNLSDSHLLDGFRNVCTELTGSNCSIYTVNSSGLGTAHFKSSDDVGDSSLKQLATETGGRYFGNIESYETINQEIQNLTGTYYVLGYPIGELWDGKFHTIEVRVKRKDCNVYGQKGYFNPKPYSEYSNNEKFLHLIDLALSEKPQLQEAVDFPLTVVPYDAKEKTDLFVLAKIPTNRIQEKAGEKTEIVTIVFNAQNEIAALRRKEVNLGQYGTNEVIDVSTISLAPGPYECRVVTRNMATGKGARGAYQVSVSETRKSSFILLPPLLLEPGRQSIFIEEGTPTKKEARFLDIFQFDTNQYYPLVGKLGKTATKLLAVVRCIIAGAKELKISFSGSLAEISSQKSIPISITLVGRYQERETYGYLLNLDVGGLEPGRYSLNISANVKNSDLKASASSSFVVDGARGNIPALKKKSNSDK
jgi:VWFA-related protein